MVIFLLSSICWWRSTFHLFCHLCIFLQRCSLHLQTSYRYLELFLPVHGCLPIFSHSISLKVKFFLLLIIIIIMNSSYSLQNSLYYLKNTPISQPFIPLQSFASSIWYVYSFLCFYHTHTPCGFQCCTQVTCLESESSPKSLGSSLKSSRKSLGPSLKSSPMSLYPCRKSSRKS